MRLRDNEAMTIPHMAMIEKTRFNISSWRTEGDPMKSVKRRRAVQMAAVITTRWDSFEDDQNPMMATGIAYRIPTVGPNEMSGSAKNIAAMSITVSPQLNGFAHSMS